jgi:hypothetical protein
MIHETERKHGKGLCLVIQMMEIAGGSCVRLQAGVLLRQSMSCERSQAHTTKKPSRIPSATTRLSRALERRTARLAAQYRAEIHNDCDANCNLV